MELRSGRRFRDAYDAPPSPPALGAAVYTAAMGDAPPLPLHGGGSRWIPTPTRLRSRVFPPLPPWGVERFLSPP